MSGGSLRGGGRKDAVKVTSTRDDRKKKNELLKNSRSSNEQEQVPSNQVKCLIRSSDAWNIYLILTT